MNLCELCEPVFQFVCRLNRGGRQGVKDDVDVVRAEVNRLLTSVQAAAMGDARLAGQYEKMSKPLVYFVDSMIASGRSSIAQAWDKRRLAYDGQEFAGDQKFWDLLDETLNEPQSEGANERLAVFYTCVGLGFTGFYFGKQDFIKRKMAQMAARLERGGGSELKERICPEAYESVDRRILFERPTSKLIGIAIVVAGLVVVLFVMNAVLYRQVSVDLSKAFGRILESAPPEPGAQTVPDARGEGGR
jgi:type VI protein secretion system component VasF